RLERAARGAVPWSLHPLAGAHARRRLRATLARGCETPLEAMRRGPYRLKGVPLAALLGLPDRARHVVAARPCAEHAVLESQRDAGERVQQAAIVRDDDADPAKPHQGVEEQRAGVAVEMIRRLVEEQDARIGSQRRSHLPSLALARRERRPAIEQRRQQSQLPAPP